MSRPRLWKIAAIAGGAIAGVIIARWLRRPNKVKVFDTGEKTDIGRKDRSESMFGYLNRSATRGSEASRALIEDWFSRVPGAEQGDIRSRFRCGENVQFATAFQELFLHEFLLRQKCKLDFHPSIAGTTKRPDFEVRQPQRGSFILEACTSTDISSGPESSPRGDRIRDFLQHMQLEGYRLGIDELTVGSKDLPHKALTKHINDALGTQSGDADGIVTIPPFVNADGWRIRLTAFSSARYGSTRPQGSVMQEAWRRTWTGPSYPLRDALKKKGSRYGKQLAMPYVIAVNAADVMLTDREFEETLFGVRRGVTIAGMTPSLARGFWGTESAPNHRRVSAVLFTKNLWPATVLMGQVYAFLYLNPWADRPYEGLLTELPSMRFENGAVRHYSGALLHELMNLRPQTDTSIWD